jgi:hypothetical protein
VKYVLGWLWLVRRRRRRRSREQDDILNYNNGLV